MIYLFRSCEQNETTELTIEYHTHRVVVVFLVVATDDIVAVVPLVVQVLRLRALR